MPYVLIRSSGSQPIYWHAVDAAPRPAVTAAGIDLKLAAVPGRQVDLQVANGDLVMDAGFGTLTLAALWTDRRADLEDGLRPDDDPRGWWGDRTEMRWGSRLWLLDRAKRVPDTLLLAQDAAREGLELLRTMGIAERVRVQASFAASGELVLDIEIDRGSGSDWDAAWVGTQQELAAESSTQALRLLFV
jgi:phage gp46-like protein